MQDISYNSARVDDEHVNILAEGKDKARRVNTFLCAHVLYVLALAAVLALCLLVGCATPKAVEEHHHHYYNADTAAVRAQVDSRMSSWREEMQTVVSVAVSQQLTQQQQSEHQQETITELITVTTDSLGREVRQEQRTITRDVTRELQQQEQRITQEYEARLHTVVDSVNDIWQSRYDSIAAHVQQLDSTFVKKEPVGDTRPWYRRLWDGLKWFFIGAIVAIILWFTRKWWLRLFINF